MSITAEMVTRGFELVAGSRDGICRATEGHSLTTWRAVQLSKAGVLGATSAAIPVAGYATLPVELLVLMRWMHQAALGIGCIKVGEIRDGDFRNIMALWAGQAELTDELGRYVTTRMVAEKAAAAGAVSAAGLFTKAFALGAEAVGGAQLGSRLAETVASRLAPHLASKTATRWMPLISAAVGGAANLLLIQRIMSVSERYYEFAEQQEEVLARVEPGVDPRAAGESPPEPA
ncbi:MAG: hypothetical protein R3349_02460 [Geminicoccaceae bacterium]|nr:hypothetical protein [Geminicoccaceae bacterium]